MKCKFRNSFVLTFIQNAGGGGVVSVSLAKLLKKKCEILFQFRNSFTASEARSLLSGWFTELESRSTFVTSLSRGLCELASDFIQEALAVRNRSAEILRDGLSHIRQSVTHAQIYARSSSGRIHHDRHVFARVVRGLPAWIGIASVVCRDDQHVGETQQRQKVRQHDVKFFQRLGESFDIFSVAIEHVEVRQICEDEPALPLADRGRQFFHPVGVVFRRDVFFDAAAIVYVMNLADSKHSHFAFRQDIREHWFRRVHRIVMPARSAHKVAWRSRERPRDHSPDAMRPVQQFPRDFAHTVKFGDGNNVFVRGNLKYAVARGVHDRFSRSYVFFAQLLDDFRSRCRLVSNRFPADQFFKLFDQIFGKSVLVNRKRLLQPRSRHFPVSGRRIFSWRARRSFPVCSQRRRGRGHVSQRRDIRESQAHEIRYIQRPRLRDMPKRGPSGVAVIGCIREFADSHAVQNNPDDSFKFSHANVPRLFSGTLAYTLVIAITSRLAPARAILRLRLQNGDTALNSFSFLCVLQDSGGLPWPSTGIPGEFRLFSRLCSSRSALFFYFTIGARLSIPCRFLQPTGLSSSFLSVSEKFGITSKEAGIPTRRSDFRSAPRLARWHSFSSSCFFSGTGAVFPAGTGSIPGESTPRRPWICREQSQRAPSWR